MAKKITFGFTQDSNYRFIPVNGVWGGVTSRGDVKVDFFYESFRVPAEVTHELTRDSRIGKELDRQPEQYCERTVMVGMMLTVEQADSIGRWLQEKALEARTAREGLGGDDGEPVIVTTH